MADPSGVDDQQFMMLRTAMGDKMRVLYKILLFEHIGRQQSSSAEWQKRLPERAKRLEEILYTTFPDKNDYYNMMKGPVESQMQFAIKTWGCFSWKKDLNHGDVSEQSASLPADVQNNNADKIDRTGEILY